MNKIIISLENSKEWWEQKLREINGEERRAVLLKKLKIFMWIEIFVIFLSAASSLNILILIGALIFFLAHSLHLEYERKMGMLDQRLLNEKIAAHLSEWQSIINFYESIFQQNWEINTVKSLEEKYKLRNGLSGEDLQSYENEIMEKLTQGMSFLHQNFTEIEKYHSQGAYEKMKMAKEAFFQKYNSTEKGENYYFHQIIADYKERIAQWAHT